MANLSKRKLKCKKRVRESLRYTSKKYTFAVRLSNKNIYVLVMCSKTRNVLTQVSTLTPAFKQGEQNKSSNKEVAARLGEFAAKYIKDKGFEASFAFDRGDKKYCGKVKEVIDSAINNGLLTSEEK